MSIDEPFGCLSKRASRSSPLLIRIPLREISTKPGKELLKYSPPFTMTSTPNPNGCVAWSPSTFGTSVYGYRPSFDLGVIFCTLFGVSLLLHSGQTLCKKQWWLLVFVLGALSKSQWSMGSSSISWNMPSELLTRLLKHS